MKTRPYDPSGDWVPVYNLNQMVEGKEAVGRAVDLRLNFYYGEWWENRGIGFRVPEFLIANIRSGEITLLANYIASYVNETEGVRGVRDVTIIKDRHNAKFRCVAMTDEGKKTMVEVDLDGLV